ncbi:MAG: metallophosphoesterase family protein [Solirubrobacterales bacterium]|nr:metallophosphoesterase family protein [Solirubrobacterales bacterium]
MSEISRRNLLKSATAAGVGLTVAEQLAPSEASAHPAKASHAPTPASAPPITGIHLQFGQDPASTMVVTWQTYGAVDNPRVEFAPADGRRRFRPVPAETRTYTDPKEPDEPVYVHSATLSGLQPNTAYVYTVLQEGADVEVGDFTTAPRGRAPFTFTSYGDQGTPTMTAPTNLPAPAPAFKNDNLGSPAAGDVTAGVEKIAPLFHLVNGDLCYANLSSVPVRTWSDWFASNSRSARYRAWMPTAGNHENEALGTTGFEPYQTYFSLPDNGQPDRFQGLWYAFRVGSVKVIAINNDDVCYQDAGSSYVHGYSGGAQQRWLENELAKARADRSIDWVVICMHQVAMSTAKGFNGADLGIRQSWMPLFDKYGVDLVVAGHEHHYERTQPVRGTNGSTLLTPQPVSGAQSSVIDTTQGTVHMIIGGGGTSAPSNALLTDPPVCQVLTSVGPGRTNGKLTANYSQEDATWASVRDKDFAYGFAAFSVDPGDRPGGQTSIAVTYYRVKGFGGELEAYDAFKLVRPRRD